MNKVKQIPVQEAVGQILAHDMTQIIPGKSKGPRFKKGHIVQPEDIPVLLSMGKEHIYTLELDEFTYHENDAAYHLAAICQGENLECTDVAEGRINLKAAVDGLLRVNVPLLDRINLYGEVMVATRRNGAPVTRGTVVAGTRAIPLWIAKEKIHQCEKIAAGEKIVSVRPFVPQRAGILTTGSEVCKGLVKDGFLEVLPAKLKPYGYTIVDHRYSMDDKESIVRQLQEMLAENLDLILCTGGMSVDPDDNTPGAIQAVSTQVVTYGTPVLPGAMFMAAYHHSTVLLGLPGSVMFHPKTVFDLVLPLAAAQEPITREYIASLGHGGLL